MKNLKNLGEALNKNEQKSINGGGARCGKNGSPCGWYNGAYQGTCYNGGCYVGP